MIAPEGWFNYTGAIRRLHSGVWHGRARPCTDGSQHPGLVGDQPEFELVDGTLTLKRAESSIALRRNVHYSRWGDPASEVRLEIGGAVEATASDGDVLTVLREGTGDCGLTLSTGKDLRVGLGAVRCDETLKIEEDPRADEMDLYEVAARLEAGDTAFIWLDVSDPNLETVIQTMHDLPGNHLVIAVTGEDRGARLRLNHRIFGVAMALGQSSCAYVDVDDRFTSRAQWLAYLRTLPKSRPGDLWIRFTASEQSVVLTEGQYAFMDPWHLFVQRVFTPGDPGQLSQLAIVRSHPAVSKEMVIESAQKIAEGLREIRR